MWFQIFKHFIEEFSIVKKVFKTLIKLFLTKLFQNIQSKKLEVAKSSDLSERHDPRNDRNIFGYRLNNRAVISIRLIETNLSSNRSIRLSNREARFEN